MGFRYSGGRSAFSGTAVYPATQDGTATTPGPWENAWKLRKSDTDESTYAVVIRGTIGAKDSIIQDIITTSIAAAVATLLRAALHDAINDPADRYGPRDRGYSRKSSVFAQPKPGSPNVTPGDPLYQRHLPAYRILIRNNINTT